VEGGTSVATMIGINRLSKTGEQKKKTKKARRKYGEKGDCGKQDETLGIDVGGHGTGCNPGGMPKTGIFISFPLPQLTCLSQSATLNT